MTRTAAEQYQPAESDEFQADAKDAAAIMENDTDLDDIHDDDEDDDDEEYDKVDYPNNGGVIEMKDFPDDDNNSGIYDSDDSQSHMHHHHPPHALSSRQVWQRRLLRVAVVLTTACVAYAVPDFGEYLSLVGSSICTILGFLLPAYFHLQVFGNELALWEYAINVFLLVGGCLFAIVGTMQSMSNMAAAASTSGGGEGG